MINCRGLNCHLACIINIVSALNINYREAFATLWSETEFTHHPEHHIYISKRIFTNLDALGIKIKTLNCSSKEETEENLSLIPKGELFYIGMDNFYTPWSPVYQHFRGSHYFYMQKEYEKDNSLLCFDPIYNKENMHLSFKDVISNAFDIGRIYKVPSKQQEFKLSSEAEEIIRIYPELQISLQNEIDNCINGEKKLFKPLLNQIDAMIKNRYLFQHYLFQYFPDSNNNCMFFNNSYFSQWDAIKNGLYKAYLLKSNENIVNEVRDLLMNTTYKETVMANDMIKMSINKVIVTRQKHLLF